MALLREFANDIEADLLFKGVDIFDWYEGRMSSRRLLVLIERLPEDGAFKTAAREGDWDFDRHISVAMLNETRAMRADLRAMIAREKTMYQPILSPRQEAERDKGQQLSRTLHDELLARLRGEK